MVTKIVNTEMWNSARIVLRLLTAHGNCNLHVWCCQLCLTSGWFTAATVCVTCSRHVCCDQQRNHRKLQSIVSSNSESLMVSCKEMRCKERQENHIWYQGIFSNASVWKTSLKIHLPTRDRGLLCCVVLNITLRKKVTDENCSLFSLS